MKQKIIVSALLLAADVAGVKSAGNDIRLK